MHILTMLFCFAKWKTLNHSTYCGKPLRVCSPGTVIQITQSFQKKHVRFIHRMPFVSVSIVSLIFAWVGCMLHQYMKPISWWSVCTLVEVPSMWWVGVACMGVARTFFLYPIYNDGLGSPSSLIILHTNSTHVLESSIIRAAI